MSSSKAKSLLIGASGQLGAQIFHLLGPERSMVSSRRATKPGQVPLDLAALATVDDAERALETHPLDGIYCTAGMTAVDACEHMPELAHNINCRGPEMLAHVATRRNVPFVYLSTEYVFDGTDGPYTEDDPANPLSVYGKSKWDGELAVQAACSHALILRTTVVYGQDFGEKNYVYSLMRNLAAGKGMRVPRDQISTPTYNRDLAAATLGLAECGTTGVYHACGPERMDRLEFARRVAEFLLLDASLLTGVPTSALGQKAVRPLDAGLSIDKLRRMHPGVTMRPLAEALADCRDDLEKFLRTCTAQP